MYNHSVYLPPSSAPALLQCACYDSKKEATDDSIIGVQGHSLCEDLFVGREPEKYSELSIYDIEDCKWAAEYAKNWCAANFPGETPQTECGLELVSDSGEKITAGTADLALSAGIGDYKMLFDYLPEEHYYKPQMCFYALMIMRKNKTDSCKVLEIYIKPKKSKEYVVSYAEASAIVEAVILRKGAENPVPQPCDFCRMCSNLTACPAINERLFSVMERYSPVSFDAIHDPTAIVDPRIMSQALVFVKRILTPWCEAISDQALAMSATQDIPYFILREKAGRKTISDSKEAFRIINGKYPSFDEDAFLNCSTFSISKAGELLAVLSGMAATKAKKEITEILTPVTDCGEPSKYLQMVVDKKVKGAE